MGRKRQKNGCKGSRRRRRHVGLNPYDEEQLKAELRLTTPSEPWIEAQFRTVLDQDADRGPIVYRYRDPHVFPPGGEQTRMVRCATCGIFNPPNAIEHGSCLDHADHRGWGPSPSAIAIAALRKLNLELEDTLELAPEDAMSLRREITEFAKKGAKIEVGSEKCKSRRRKKKQEGM